MAVESGEKVLNVVKTNEQARNKTLDITGDLGAYSKPYIGRLGTGDVKLLKSQMEIRL